MLTVSLRVSKALIAFFVCLLSSTAAFAHAPDVRADQYLKFYDVVFDQLVKLQQEPRETGGQPFYYHDGKRVYFHGDAFSAIFDEAIKIYVAGIQEDCPKCETGPIETDARGKFRKLCDWAKRNGIRLAKSVAYPVAHPLKAGASVIDFGKDMVVELRGGLYEMAQRRGMLAAILFVPYFLVMESLEHLVIAPFLPPNPVTCWAIAGAYSGVAGFFVDTVRMLVNTVTPVPLGHRLVRAVYPMYYKAKFSRRWRWLYWADRKIDKRRSDYRKELMNEGRKLEAYLASQAFWGELYVNLEMRGIAPKTATTDQVSDGRLEKDLAFIFDRVEGGDALDATDKRVWRVYALTNGLYLMRDLVGEAWRSAYHESEYSSNPMTMREYELARGELGKVGKAIDLIYTDLFAIALADNPKPKQSAAMLRERMVAVLNLLQGLRGRLGQRDSHGKCERDAALLVAEGT